MVCAIADWTPAAGSGEAPSSPDTPLAPSLSPAASLVPLAVGCSVCPRVGVRQGNTSGHVDLLFAYLGAKKVRI